MAMRGEAKARFVQKVGLVVLVAIAAAGCGATAERAAVPPGTQTAGPDNKEVGLLVDRLLEVHWKTPAAREAVLNATDACQDVRLVPLLIEFAADGPDMLRIRAIQKLGVLKSQDAVEPLGKLLHDKNKNVRYVTVSALRAIGGKKALEQIVVAISDEDGDVRRVAANSLGPMRAAVDDAMLGDLMKQNDAKARVAALEIALVGKSKQLPEMIKAGLSDAAPEVRAKALMTAAQSGTGGVSVSDIQRFIVDPDKGIRAAAVAVAGGIHDAQVPALLAARLKDDDVEVRRTVAIASGSLKVEDAVPLLAQLLSDASSAVRRQAVGTLSGIYSSEDKTLPLLKKAASDKDAEVALAAIYTLEERKAPDFIETVLSAYERFPASSRSQLIHVIARLDDARVRGILTKALQSDFPSLKFAVIQSLGSLKADLAADLAEMASNDAYPGFRRELIRQITGRLADARFLAIVTKLAKDSEESVAALAKSCLSSKK